MKATELMIGDWVYDTILKGNTRVNILSLSGIRGDFHENVWNEKTFEPIPITPEILEKNGFIKDAYKDDRLTDAYHLLVPTGFERNSFTIQVSLYKEPICGVSTLVKCWGWLPPYNGGMNDIHLCSANYVHELQHALKLCGITKEIAL